MTKKEKTPKTNAEWRARLTPEQFAVTRHGATEPPFSGAHYHNHAPGEYRCVCCGALLFSSKDKYDSGSGWPQLHPACGRRNDCDPRWTGVSAWCAPKRPAHAATPTSATCSRTARARRPGSAGASTPRRSSSLEPRKGAMIADSPIAAWLLIPVGFVAGALNVVAGGGSFLTLPLLIFMGLPHNVANGTNRLAILIQTAGATAAFRRADVIPVSVMIRLGAAAVLGAGLGSTLAVHVGEAFFLLLLVDRDGAVHPVPSPPPQRPGQRRTGRCTPGRGGTPRGVRRSRVLWRIRPGRGRVLVPRGHELGRITGSSPGTPSRSDASSCSPSSLSPSSP